MTSMIAVVMSSKPMLLTTAVMVLAVINFCLVTGRVRENSTVLSRSSLEIISLPHIAEAMDNRSA